MVQALQRTKISSYLLYLKQNRYNKMDSINCMELEVKPENRTNLLLKWTNQEDRLLWSLQVEKKIKSWEIIAKTLTNSCIGQQKTGKQCRERYINYLRFGVPAKQENRSWTPQQDVLLFEKFMKYGPKWVIISQQLVHKSENVIKNRFYNAIGRMSRIIHNVQLEKKLKNKKPITPRRLIKLFQEIGHCLDKASFSTSTYPQNNYHTQSFRRLSQDLIKMATQAKERPFSKEDVFSVIKQIYEFNSVGIKKIGKNSDNSNSKASLEGEKSEQLSKDQIKLEEGQRKKYETSVNSVSGDLMKKDISGNEGKQWEECLVQLPELSQNQNNFISSQNLDEQLCLIENREYIRHEFFPFCL